RFFADHHAGVLFYLAGLSRGMAGVEALAFPRCGCCGAGVDGVYLPGWYTRSSHGAAAALVGYPGVDRLGVSELCPVVLPDWRSLVAAGFVRLVFSLRVDCRLFASG